MKRSTTRHGGKAVRHFTRETIYGALVVIILAFCLFPVFWMLLMSFKTRVETIDPSVWIFRPTLANYAKVFISDNLFLFLKNSIITVLGTTAVSIVLGTIGAYGFARFRFKARENVAFWILSLRMLPPLTVVIPFFLLGHFVGLLDTRLLLVIVYLSFNIPFVIWMMRGFIEDVPIELEESAWIDGCGRLRAAIAIVFPIVLPGLVATAIFCVIQSWNEFALAFFLTSFQARTLPTIITSFLSVLGVLWGQMASVGVVSTVPIVVFAVFVQKYLVRGLTLGALKD